MITQVEFGPWLGVVASPKPRPAVGQLSLDSVRLGLVTRLLTESHQEAPDWVAAWQAAVEEAVRHTLATLDRRVAAAAAASRAPERVARQAVPDADDIRILRARLASSGIPLELAIETLPRDAAPARSFPSIGAAVEESWLGLERMVESVVGEWTPRIAAVAAWRRPTLWLWVASGIAAGGALTFGLAIGGYVDASAWFRPVVSWWWSLPWP
jgi:hypothetical protein